MALNAVLMNDTRPLGHFGCMRVMRRIEDMLASRGIHVIATSLVRADWQNDAEFLAAVARCHVILVNGEGTMHHGAGHAKRLLDIVDHPARGSTPVVLANALYQDNPGEWSCQLDRLSLISARDSRSAAELSRVTRTPVRHVDDLSMSAGFVSPAASGRRRGVIIGDSVFPDVSARLATLANGRRLPIHVLPIQDRSLTAADSRPMPRESWWRRLRWMKGLAGHGPCRSEQDYIDRLCGAALHLTGRFHAVCLSLVTRTPFLCLASNSWKIEALLDDFGLGQGRLVSEDTLAEAVAKPDAFAFSDAERAAIDRGVERCHAAASRLFDEIRALAESGAQP